MVSDQLYLRHMNRDGTIDSICKFCYRTVCTSDWETDLVRAEREHTCDSNRMAKSKQRWERGGGKAEDHAES